MKRSASLFVLVALCLPTASQATVVNLANSATGFGLLPVIALDQGGPIPAGIADGSLFSWFGPATSPRTFAGSNIQTYMTWPTNQNVQIIRAHRDAAGPWSRLMIDTLNATNNPAVEGNWDNRYDSGVGSFDFLDVDLGAAYSTRGVRVRGFSAADTDVGEVAVFGIQEFAGNLTSLKAAPTSFAASSSEFRAPLLAVNGDWYDGGWLSAAPGANPGADYTYDLFFAGGLDINGVSYAWTTQGGLSAIPSSWELLIDKGNGLVSLGLFSPVIAQNGTPRMQYYYDFGPIADIEQIRLRIPEAGVGGGGRVGLMEFEAFMTESVPPPVPEPSTLLLMGLGLAVMASRRRSRASRHVA